MKVEFRVVVAFTSRALTGDRMTIVPDGALAMLLHLRAPGR